MKMNTGLINKAIVGIISIVVLMLLYAELVPEAQTAGNTLNASGVPLGGLFDASGVVILIIMVGLVVTAVGFFLKGRK